MLFAGAELANMLSRSNDGIELRNQFGRCLRLLSREQALALDMDLFVGIGKRHSRIFASRIDQMRSMRFDILRRYQPPP